MEKKIKILQLSPQFPFPQDDGGKIGIANIFTEFVNQGAQVTFFSFDDGHAKSEDIRTAEKYGKVILFNYSTRNSPLRIFQSLFRKQPLFLFKHFNKKIINFLLKEIENTEFDIIHADHSSMMPLAIYLKNLLNIPVGLRLHNIEWMIWYRYAETLSKFHPKRLYLQRQAKLLKTAEKKYYSLADVCFAITEPDKARSLELSSKANVRVASAGVNINEWHPDKSIVRNPHELVLATTYNWIHNVDAVRWFLDSVFPIILKNFPDAKLKLIGKNPPDWLKDSKNKNLDVLGYVPQVQPYLSRASVYIAPLFVGGGIRIKILEAMAMELPVVATSISAEGIDAGYENGLIIADDEKAFAESIISLLEDHSLTERLGKMSREYVSKKYSWQKNVKIMMDSYHELLNKAVKYS